MKLTRAEIGWIQQLLYQEADKMRRYAREKEHIFITTTIASIQADNYELLLTKLSNLVGDGDTQEFKRETGGRRFGARGCFPPRKTGRAIWE